MDAEQWAIMVLCTYGLMAIAVVVWQVVRCPEGLSAWFLFCVTRIYIPLMFRCRTNGRCPFPADGPALIIANHQSPVDPIFLWQNHHLGAEGRRRIRVISFLTAEEYCKKPGIAWICRAMKSIPVDRSRRDMDSVKKALRLLQDGAWVGVFPEGGINLEPGLREGNPGVAWLALRSQAPVYPAFIHNAPTGRTMVEPFCNPSQTRVTYGEPIDLSAYYGRRINRKLLAEVTGQLMNRLAEVGGLTSELSESEPPASVPFRQAAR